MVLSSDEPAGLPWDLLFFAGFCWRLLGVRWIDYDWDLNETENKQVYATTENGNFIGYQSKDKDAYYLSDFFGGRIEIAGKVLKASKIEWTRQV